MRPGVKVKVVLCYYKTVEKLRHNQFVSIFQSDDVRDFINKEFEGVIIPVW